MHLLTDFCSFDTEREMKVGDVVQFLQERFKRSHIDQCGIWDCKIGILVKYEGSDSMTSVFCDGKLFQIHESRIEYLDQEFQLDEGW